MAGGGLRLDAVAGVGDLGTAILAQVPAAFRAQVEPFIPTIVQAIHEAFSLATASTFYLGIGASLLAAVAVMLLREVPIGDEQPARASATAAPARVIGEPGA
jgi:hypothetical protein